MDKIFPTILIALDIAAGAVYALHGDIRKTILASAAILTASVTY